MKSVSLGGLLALTMIITNLTACGSSGNSGRAAEPAESSENIQLGERSYLLGLPANFDKNKEHKLLLVFHGSGGSSDGMRSSARFEQLSSDYIVAYPKSLEVEWNEGCDCNIAHRKGADDLGFIQQVIEDVGKRYALQEGEIYAAGFSQGALFAQNVACNMGDQVKAIATVAAPMSKQLAQSCPMQTPVSVMMVHGTADNVLSYYGSDHANWGLLSSQEAVARFAELSGSLPNPLLKSSEQNIGLIHYTNGAQKVQLHSIIGGGHSWRFSNFDTSNQILTFFAGLDAPELPEHSQLVEVQGQKFHVRSMGEQNTGPAILLLPGFNYNYFNDSAWYSLLQPYLAQTYRVHSIDRLGNGFSDMSEEVNLTRFAEDLNSILNEINEKHVLLVAFSSASITASQFYQHRSDDVQLAGMLWIDPDIAGPHSLSLYKGYPADWYLANLDALLPILAEGKWTARTWNKLVVEREEIAALIPEAVAPLMDWNFLDVVSQQRMLVGPQQTRAREIAFYANDLDAYAVLALPSSVPVSVIDSDFEEKDIQNNPDNAEMLRLWQQEGTAWSKQVAEFSSGQYISLEQTDHMVMFQKPEAIKQAIDWLVAHGQ
ncbi:alpha/beta fold hydrolase [Bowmanella yangjiangensis]|uniref:Alpha/beta hydrolase n=1 Tax=Bowmanella yangjiangensis TaxID=2811230 RepID=A0ABS3CSY7_9ALTE|nr:alpha/beta hydrolase [Bowmanella yangjiangensis]MBN7819536.1 alpha/beta hydrolase [Bowmanella yangjiangensis]